MINDVSVVFDSHWLGRKGTHHLCDDLINREGTIDDATFDVAEDSVNLGAGWSGETRPDEAKHFPKGADCRTNRFSFLGTSFLDLVEDLDDLVFTEHMGWSRRPRRLNRRVRWFGERRRFLRDGGERRLALLFRFRFLSTPLYTPS